MALAHHPTTYRWIAGPIWVDMGTCRYWVSRWVGASSLEVVVRLFTLLINKGVLLIIIIMTTTTKAKTVGTEGEQNKKFQSPDSPFSFERQPGVQMMGTANETVEKDELDM